MSLRSQAARGVFWSASGNWGFQLTSLAVFTILSRLLSPEDFGVVALALVFTGLLKLLAEQGLADALIQRTELEPEHMDTAFWVSIGTGTVLAALLAVSSPLIADLVNEPEFAPVLTALSAVLILTGLSSVQRALLTRDMRFATLTARTLFSVVVGGLVGVVAALVGLGVWSLVLQQLTIEVVGVIVLWTAGGWRPRLRFSRAHLRDVLPFGANAAGFRLLRFFNTRVDNLVVGAVLGTTALGFYVVAYRLLEMLLNLTTTIVGKVAFPVFSRIQDDRERILSAYYRIISLTSAIAFPSFLGLVVVAPEVTQLVFGSQWEQSVPVMRVLALAGLIDSVIFLNNIVIKALGKPSWRVVITGVTAMASVPAFLVAVNWGIVVVAAAFTAVSLAMAPLWLFGVNKLVPLDPLRYLGRIAPPLVSSIVMMALVFALKGVVGELRLVWQVVVLIGAGVISYGAVLWAIGRPIAREALAFGQLAIPSREQRPPAGSTR